MESLTEHPHGTRLSVSSSIVNLVFNTLIRLFLANCVYTWLRKITIHIYSYRWLFMYVVNPRPSPDEPIKALGKHVRTTKLWRIALFLWNLFGHTFNYLWGTHLYYIWWYEWWFDSCLYLCQWFFLFVSFGHSVHIIELTVMF